MSKSKELTLYGTNSFFRRFSVKGDTCVLLGVKVCFYRYIRTYICLHICKDLCKHIYTYICEYIYIYIYTYKYTYTHIYNTNKFNSIESRYELY